MTGPRQTARIAHKTARLEARPDRGGAAPTRRAKSKDIGPPPPRCEKVAHATEWDAQRHIDDLTAAGDPDAHRLNYYDCGVCGLIHVGHRARRKGRRR